MNEKIKNFIGATIIFSLFILAYSALSYVKSYSKSVDFSFSQSFLVSGEEKVIVIPDVAKFTFSVISQGGKDIGRLQKENTEKTNKAIEFLKSQGTEPKDIKTQGYNLEPRYQYFSCPKPLDEVSRPCSPPEIVGYTITQNVGVKVRDFSRIGDVLGGVVENGANSVSQLSFEIDDPVKLQNEAREKAILQAKEKAALIAKAGGFRIGKLLSIEEGFIRPFARFEALGKGGEEVPVLTPSPIIEPGSQEITVNVTLRYEIE